MLLTIMYTQRPKLVWQTRDTQNRSSCHQPDLFTHVIRITYNVFPHRRHKFTAWSPPVTEQYCFKGITYVRNQQVAKSWFVLIFLILAGAQKLWQRCTEHQPSLGSVFWKQQLHLWTSLVSHALVCTIHTTTHSGTRLGEFLTITTACRQLQVARLIVMDERVQGL